MEWVKTAILASVVWFFASIALCIGWALYVPSGPLRTPEAKRARVAQVGEMAGMIAGAGIGVIWLGLFARSNMQSRRPKGKKKRRRPGEPRRGNG
jgi:hypothetical protein